MDNRDEDGGDRYSERDDEGPTGNLSHLSLFRQFLATVSATVPTAPPPTYVSTNKDQSSRRKTGATKSAVPTSAARRDIDGIPHHFRERGEKETTHKDGRPSRQPQPLPHAPTSHSIQEENGVLKLLLQEAKEEREGLLDAIDGMRKLLLEEQILGTG